MEGGVSIPRERDASDPVGERDASGVDAEHGRPNQCETGAGQVMPSAGQVMPSAGQVMPPAGRHVLPRRGWRQNEGKGDGGAVTVLRLCLVCGVRGRGAMLWVGRCARV